MEEQRAHELYTEFAAVDAGARFKQGIGFAGKGAPKALQGWADKDDDDVIARNRRLFGGDRGRQDERCSPEYDSDTAEAVQRRLRELKREQRAQQPEGAAPLPGRLYDEQRERRQQRHEEKGRAEPGRRRSRSRQRHRSRSRERRRSRSRSREGHRHRHSDSRSHRQRSRSGERGWHGHRYRSERRHRRSRSRERRPREERVPAGGGSAGGGGSGMQRLDFEALIPGYSAMSAPQRLKAKMQYLLERSEAKDKRQQQGRGGQEEGGEQQQWTRYKFSAAAELEEHRLQPAAVYGPGEEGAEDVAAAGLDGLSAVTFKQGNAAAVQQERDDSHAAAIFGGSGGGAGCAARTTTGAARGPGVPARHPHRSAVDERSSLQGRGGAAAAAAAAGSTEDLLALAEAEGAVVVPAAEVAAVLHQPQPAAAAVGDSGGGSGALSWRERALAAKRAKQQQQ